MITITMMMMMIMKVLVMFVCNSRCRPASSSSYPPCYPLPHMAHPPAHVLPQLHHQPGHLLLQATPRPCPSCHPAATASRHRRQQRGARSSRQGSIHCTHAADEAQEDRAAPHRVGQQGGQAL
jgi:hypothetical protein